MCIFSQFGVATFQVLDSHTWLVAPVLDRTVLDAGNKAASNTVKVPVFVEFPFYSKEDTENYKNKKREQMVLEALKKPKRLMR